MSNDNVKTTWQCERGLNLQLLSALWSFIVSFLLSPLLCRGFWLQHAAVFSSNNQKRTKNLVLTTCSAAFSRQTQSQIFPKKALKVEWILDLHLANMSLKCWIVTACKQVLHINLKGVDIVCPCCVHSFPLWTPSWPEKQYKQSMSNYQFMCY